MTILAKPWIWSFGGALLVFLAAIGFTGGYGASGMITAALSLSLFMVIVGVGQMFVITLGRAMSTCRCPPISGSPAPSP